MLRHEKDQAALDHLLAQVRACRACEAQLPLGPRPVLRAQASARVLLVGQAPGTAVHRSGIPWNDPSGERLRGWLQCPRDLFYDDSQVAIIPMGLCYPGKGARGDLPPRRECRDLWFEALLALLPNIRLRLLIGRHAQEHYLGNRRKKTLTETIRHFEEYLPQNFPLVHPSPRNVMWRRRNPWFEEKVVPRVQEEFWRALDD